MTQATLSRDIHELGLVKTAEGYKVPQGEEAEIHLPSIERLIQEFVYDVKTAQNLVVVKTSPGSAQPVSAAMDAEEWDEVVGTIGGDDTILAIASRCEVRSQAVATHPRISCIRMNTRIQPAVFGATGYSGFELVRLLSRHAGVKKPLLLRRNGESGEYGDLSEAYPQLSGNGGFPFESFSWERMKQAGVDVVFFATPHEFSRELVPGSHQPRFSRD